VVVQRQPDPVVATTEVANEELAVGGSKSA